MICYINRSTVEYDVRLQKYVTSCIDTSTNYIVISWDRTNNCTKKYPNEYQYKVQCPYGAGRQHLFAMIGWVFFVIYHLIRHITKYKVIHACNIENTVIAAPFKLFGKKIIIDIYDSVNTKLERTYIKWCNLLILPHLKRAEQIGCQDYNHKTFIVENVPHFDLLTPNISIPNFSQKIRLSYVGVMQRNIRGLENLIEFVKKNDNIELNIAGVGDGFENMLTIVAKECNRIIYHGKVNYAKALSIMSESDFIVALYYTSAKTHIYASPNKYYESLYLGKPIITSKDTLVGARVQEHNTGYVIGDTYDDLIDLFRNINNNSFIDEYLHKCKNCISIWNNAYHDYYNTTIKKRYHEIIKSLAH